MSIKRRGKHDMLDMRLRKPTPRYRADAMMQDFKRQIAKEKS
jgi:hypothetical protein